MSEQSQKLMNARTIDSRGMFCSYIIPTIGRSSLERAIKSVLEQEFNHAGVEIIVVNDSGYLLPVKDWLNTDQVRVLNTNRCERSFARNSGAAIATGEYLAFLDDDDWILPGALDHFWQLVKQQPDADWLYGGIQIVDENDEVLAEINSGLNGNCFAKIMGGAWAPIQASMIRASSFFEVGGFNPLICVTEDEDLCRRIAFRGTFANSEDTIACLFRGHSWNTSSNYLQAPEATKISRDLILAEPKAFQRLWTSAGTGYWYGRILRVYLSTVSLNLKHKRLLASLSRFWYLLVGSLLSLKYSFSKKFWQGIRADHVPDTLHFVMREYESKYREQQMLNISTMDDKTNSNHIH